jgi:hypothetical protein
MSRYRVELATPADDADLRRVLAETPMPGRITVSFRREPSYFDALDDDRSCQVVAARACDDNRIVGFGARSVGARYVNGRLERIGYLSSLRLLEAHRNRGLVARGYRFFRKLHADGRARLYLTTIAEGNRVAVDILTSGRAGLPAYHYLGRYCTAAIPLSRHERVQHPSGPIDIRQACAHDLPNMLRFLESAGPNRQFFPRYQAGDFFTPHGAFRDLAPEDLLLAYRAGKLVGTLAGWDQHRFRQTVVHGYSWPLRWLRPFYNRWARWRGRPALPAPGDPFRYLLAALPVIADADPGVFAALLQTLLRRAASGSWDYLLLGLYETDPLSAVLRKCPAIRYGTRVYAVCWDDGKALYDALDGRPAYLELGCL